MPFAVRLRRLSHRVHGHHWGDCITARDGWAHCCCGERISERTWIDPCARNNQPTITLDSKALAAAVAEGQAKYSRRS